MSEILIEFFEKIPFAAFLTLKITLLGFFIGQFIGFIFGCSLHLTKGKTHYLIKTYPFFFRGTPLLIQIFLVYYGLSQLEWIRASIFWIFLQEPVGCMVIAISLNAGGYAAELVRGALSNLPRGQLEAAQSLGFSRVKALIFIEIPQAYRFLIPSLSNEIIFVLKGSSLASTVTLMEVTGITKTFIARTFSPFEFFAFAGLIYFIIGSIFVKIFRRLDNKYNQTLNFG